MDLIRLENIRKTYHMGEVDVPVLRGISLTIQRGEMVALMGASGSGKTTLMNILGCLDRPSAGKYWLDGVEMSTLTPNQRALVRSAKIGFVFQSFNLLPRTTALQNVLMPTDYAPTRPSGAELRRLAKAMLDHVGLGQRLDHEPSQMSGGQMQRVAIGRSLINRPPLLLADEPTGNLDSRTSVEILEMFQKLNAEGITVILVTHDAKVADFAHRTIRICDGLVESDGRSPLHSGSGNGNGGSSGNGHGPHLELGVAAPAAASAVCAAPAAQHEPAHGRRYDAAAAAEAPLLAAEEPAGLIAAADAGSAEAAPRAAVLFGHALPETRRWLPVLVPTTLRTAFNALRRNKMRSALTAVGILIGVAAVIAMTEIGQGSRTAVEQTIASMGANTLLLRPGAIISGGVSYGSGTGISLTPSDVDAIARQCPSVFKVTPIIGTRTQVIYGNRNWVPLTMLGTTPAYLAIREWEDMDEGEMFTDRDVRGCNKVCVIGQTIRRELFEDESPIGQEVRIRNVNCRVIGVLGRKGASMMGTDQDDIVIAPWTTVKYRICAVPLTNVNMSVTTVSTLNTLANLYPTSVSLYSVIEPQQAADTPQPVRFARVDSILMQAASTDEIPESIEEVSNVLRERHHLVEEAKPDDFNIRDMTEITRAMGSASRLMSVLLLIVAMISLAVGGVGIMNIMLVSVTERTREIGLRMAVGARSYHILRQFLVEAVVLCLAGGLLGIVCGRGASLAVREILQWPTEPSLPAVIAAVVVSAGVGVVFGFYPAYKASQLDPIDALRYE